ncbi:ABC transporter permease [Telmatocola sphagniphila]|uniref:ABC transporter permease n=1 Tax=Telmatocola sphagniphila TaxID=1123043 RepID=A0A8E6EWS7_9BACT|nr:ABC transporter permease [Telmatocola sphagniphila]QVL30476.1 ABC transporter permease [Telmatocola sphagniphila]
MSIGTLAGKDLRLLRRDARSAVILFVMPLLFVAVLGMAVGEGFGQKPDDRIRISILNLDQGLPPNPGPFPNRAWSEIFLDDLSNTADLRIELIPTREEAEAMVRQGKRSCVLILEPEFSVRLHACSFLSKTDPPELPPLNPLYRDGVNVNELGLTILKDPTQQVAASIIEQAAQVTMLRVVIPWMIGKAFERVGDEKFMARMAEDIPLMKLVPGSVRKELGPGVQKGIAKLFDRYNFTAKTWAGLTKSEPRPGNQGSYSPYVSQDGSGLLKRGALRYQILVPAYTVMFAFFLVLTVGWLFVAERRQGTLIRLRAAPIYRGEILLGKMIPCLVIAVFQGFFLLLAGKILFGMSWGTQPWGLIPVVLSTAFAAVGMSMLIAGLARTETQVAVYGTLLVLVLAGISGSMMPRDLMPEEMKSFSYITPHAWALDAYSQLLVNPIPAWNVIGLSCGVLCLFAFGFMMLAWWRIQLD